MELTIRDWMVIVGALLILAVLIDAARRLYRERRNAIRLNTKPKLRADFEDDILDLRAELPNGGARRVVRENGSEPAEAVDVGVEAVDLSTEADSADNSKEMKSAGDFESEGKPESPTAGAGAGAGAGVDSDDPSLSQSEQSEACADAAVNDSAVNRADDEPGEAVQSRAELQSEHEDLAVPSFSALDGDEPSVPPKIAPRKKKTSSARKAAAKAKKNQQLDTVDDPLLADVEPPETVDWLDQLSPPPAEKTGEATLPRDAQAEVFIINVVARSERGFAGEDILRLLLECDLRFGDMDFFHRHELAAGKGPIQFSVANMLKPGVFDIDNMANMSTQGLMFFVTLPGPEDMLKAFDYMYECAKVVARNLGGDVLDETRSALTQQSLEHTRQKIREIERRRAMKHGK